MNNEYKALTYVNLPFLDIKKAPGDIITDEELTQGGQTEDDVQALLTQGAISLDLNAPLDIDPLPTTPATSDRNVLGFDEGKGVTE
ncbi:MAG TPA: hypothetical protein VGE97_09355 [Nitrososphaera sp.]|jgi:hypothetical protein